MVEDASALRGVWATKGEALRTTAVRNLFPVPAEREPFLARLDAWLADVELSASLRRIVVERRADSLRALKCQQASYGPFGAARSAWRRPSRSTGRRSSRSCAGSPCPGSRRTTRSTRATRPPRSG